MKKSLFAIALTVQVILSGCTGTSGTRRKPQPSDTLYTWQKAMSIYAYQPEQALCIIDSALIVGNIDDFVRDLARMRVYCETQMGMQMDSILGGKKGIRFDSARVIGERLLLHEKVQEKPAFRQDVLEMLVYSARQQGDKARWFSRSKELVEVCNEQGAGTEALRTEAEIGAALCSMGHCEEGLARLDSVIGELDALPQRRFNELDATIITLKRKINVLVNDGKYVGTIPLARRIINLLDDYGKHPQYYHDNTYRKPKDADERADYINFYRSQAEGYINVAYASLGGDSNIEEAYKKIEFSVRNATAREHMARYNAKEQDSRRRQAENRSRIMTIVSVGFGIALLIILVFTALIIYQNLKIRHKNKVLVRMMENPDLGATSRPSRRLSSGPSPDLSLVGRGEDTNTMGDNVTAPLPTRERSGEGPQEEGLLGENWEENHALYKQIDTTIRNERLYADAFIGRQDICQRFGIRREMLNQLLADFAGAPSFPIYINSIRLSKACSLLKTEPAKTVNAIAEEVGLSPRNLRRLFILQYGITPTEYRQSLQEA
ncbi:MAG: AraC family transcriptional regulator [Bacteroidaceae bacterium]|nr:AraC family transcriptional regulator [Bacteroidaceae bacterium]